MIAYFKCLCTAKDKLAASKLRAAGFEIRLTNNPKWRVEAKAYGVKLPFTVKDGVVQ